MLTMRFLPWLPLRTNSSYENVVSRKVGFYVAASHYYHDTTLQEIQDSRPTVCAAFALGNSGGEVLNRLQQDLRVMPTGSYFDSWVP